MTYFIYILYSPKFNHYYIGQTNNIEIRLKQHNEDRFSWTSSHRPWKLVYKEKFETRSQAMKAEKYLKSLKNKERIRKYIAGWRSSTLPGS